MTDRKIIKKRISELRKLMKRENIDCYIIVSDDFHASEYVGDHFKEREYMSGFTGSNGTIVVTEDSAKLWTDGRYFLQAQEELEETGIDLMKDGEKDTPTIFDWIAEQKNNFQNSQKLPDVLTSDTGDNFNAAYKIGYDGRTFSLRYAEELRKTLDDEYTYHVNDGEIQTKDKVYPAKDNGYPTKDNEYLTNNIGYLIKNDMDLVDEMWPERPEISHNPIWKLEEKYSGKSSGQKLRELREILSEKGCGSILISSLEEIAWLYNFRGSDISYTPVAMAYSIVHRNKAILYTDADFGGELAEEFQKNDVEIHPYLDIYDDISAANKDKKHIFGAENVMIDPDDVNESIVSELRLCGQKLVFCQSPIKLLKAVKNNTEIENVIKAHVLDGVALTKAIYWIKHNDMSKETELSVERYLTELRKGLDGFVDLSFSSIVASSDHGAIIHYEPTIESSQSIKEGFLLIDTGAHYLYGTTDVTRTISVNPESLTYEMKRDYTAVLKGHIDLALAKFDENTTGTELDSLARQPVNDVGADYNHGTGHGVGYLLGVHEGPNAIRKPSATRKTSTFKPGMITSNEPGIYKEGQYGIRIENLLLCEQATDHTDENDAQSTRTKHSMYSDNNLNGPSNDPSNNPSNNPSNDPSNDPSKNHSGNYEKPDDIGQLCFKTLTLAPYDRAAILWDRLEDSEIAYLIDYGKILLETLSPYLSYEERTWLDLETSVPL